MDDQEAAGAGFKASYELQDFSSRGTSRRRPLCPSRKACTNEFDTNSFQEMNFRLESQLESQLERAKVSQMLENEQLDTLSPGFERLPTSREPLHKI